MHSSDLGDPHGLRYGQWLVDAVQEFNRHEYQIGIADVLKVVHLVFAEPVGFVARLAGAVAVLSRLAVIEVLPAPA